MRRRAFVGGLAIAATGGCIGVSTEEEDPDDDPETTTDAGDFAGGRSTETPTESSDFPLLDQQRIAIRNRLNDRRADEKNGALEVNGPKAATLRRLAQSHAEAMAEAGRVETSIDGSLVDTIEREYGVCAFRADEEARRYSGAEVVFLGRVGPDHAVDPNRAAEEFLGHWLDQIDARQVLLSGQAHNLGLGVAYGSDGLYVAMILC